MKIQIKKQNKKRKGFSLIELIVVIAIMAVLSVGAVVAYGNVTDAAREAAINADGQAAARALNTYNTLASAAHRITDTQNAPTRASLAALALTTGGTNPDLITMDLNVILPDSTAADVVSGLDYNTTSDIWEFTAP